ncbi:MAG: ATP-binding cassette domain-containing protein [Clostridia bacterium]|nr:ATP-binding cassette domain-containing protein [Clostridia bacterium]NCC75594.1 ATP-binding cassette domain-containing protein [Clostridia bacterium]
MIELQDVRKTYGDQVVLDRFSHGFATGSFTAISGPSGIGKTTLLQVIAGLLPIEEGQIVIDDQITDTKVQALHPSLRQVGYVFQFPALWPHLTVRQNILYGLMHQPRSLQEDRLSDIITKLDIAELMARRPAELSGGQARRVSLARTLITRPRFVLLDEPLNNLDARLKDQILSMVADYWVKQQATVIWVTHDPGEVSGLAPVVGTFSPFGLV